MTNYGIKTSRAGFDVKTAEPYQLSFSSKYQTLKVSSQHSGSIYDSTGRTVTIAHNLGYVPMFVAHANPFPDLPDTFFTLPFVEGGSIFSPGRTNIFAYADSTNVYIKCHNDFNYHYRYTGDTDENVSYEQSGDGGGCDNNVIRFGYDTGWENLKGGIRCDDIDVAKEDDVYKADIGIEVNRFQSVTVDTTVYGIDEDDTANFGCATNRAKTSASSTPSCDGGIPNGNIWSVGVTSMFNEIINRGGWSSGNAMGFQIENRGMDGAEEYVFNYGGNYIRWLPDNLLVNYKCTIFKNKIEYS